MVFLELVPNNYNKLIQNATWALSELNDITAINVPDILQLNIRSYDAAIALSKENIPAFPHIRIIDFSESELMQLCHRLFENNVKQILLISGDPPPNPLQPIHKHFLPQIISLIKKEIPELIIFAGCNPYRQHLLAEMDYCNKKIDAGASGLFTQPIFNSHFAHILLEQCQKTQLYIGISPVLTQTSYNYWITRNNVLFSPTFEPSLEYNIAIAKEILSITNQFQQHNYIMPIKTPLKPYLQKIFND